MKITKNKPAISMAMLLIWLVVGITLRFYQLDSKPPWSDEFATLVFSLGNSFRTVPLGEMITLDTLVAPLKFNSVNGVNAVIHNLLTESNHPPAFFVLNHLWLQLFSTDGELVSLGMARALSAILGVLAIPAMYGLARIAFPSRLVAQMAAALMAISPYGIYLSQETRHYTLVILLTIASLCCLILAVKTVSGFPKYNSLPIWLVAWWTVVNSLGVAVHYFFLLVIGAEAWVILWLTILQLFNTNSSIPWQPWRRIYAAGIGSVMGILVWLPNLPQTSKDGLTEWVHQDITLLSILEGVGRMLLWSLTMLMMLPLEEQAFSIMLIVSLIGIVFLIWAGKVFWQGWQFQFKQPGKRLIINVLLGYILAAIALCFVITYGLGIDLTLAARYQFGYFSALLLLLAVGLVGYMELLSEVREQGTGNREQVKIGTSLTKYFGKISSKVAVGVILLIVFLGGFSVSAHLAYQRADRPDLLLEKMIAATPDSSIPVLVTTVHKTHEQTGEMMGLAWELMRFQGDKFTPQFLFTRKDKGVDLATETLHSALDKMPRPFDLWTINFSAPRKLDNQQCDGDGRYKGKVSGYHYRLYHCY